MRTSTERRTSAPHPTADACITSQISADPPASVGGRTVDASSVPANEDVGLRLDVEVDSSQLLSGFDGSDSLPATLALSFRCDATRWSVVQEIDRFSVPPDEEQKRYPSTSAVLPRHCIDQRVDGQVVLLSAVESGPFRPGAIIAQWPFKVQLEKRGHEFPTKWISFSEENLPADALWHLDIPDGSWILEASRAAMILLNEDIEPFRSLFPEHESGLSEEGRRMAGQISYDCLATLLEIYLRDRELQAEADPNGDRLIDKAEATLKRLFSERERDRLSDHAQDAPASFRTELQAKMRKSLL